MKKNDNLFWSSLKNIATFSTIIMLLMGCKKDSVLNDTIIITGSGDITAKVNDFRQVLGAKLNTTPGAVGGRREIDWDGIPADMLEKPLSGSFFNTIGTNVAASRQRGLLYSASADNFLVSNNGFKNINVATANSFQAFSGSQTFANVSSNLWRVDFQVPGEPVAATVKGFGMVFSDVDVANSTFLEFFSENRSLGKFFVPVHDATSSFSFVGVYFKNEMVTHVQVGHDGKLAEGGSDISSGGTRDFVIFDDFLFNEPVKK